jgi:uncharacterized protein YjcR
MTRRVSPAELRRLYEQQQLAPAEIAERSGVSGRTVRAWLRRLGILLRPQPERRGRRLPPTAAELRRRYIADGLTITQLAALRGGHVNGQTVAAEFQHPSAAAWPFQPSTQP